MWTSRPGGPLEVPDEGTEALHRALLPGSVPVVPGATVAGACLIGAGEEATGGDWLDAVAAGDGSLYLAVGDVTAHGPRAVMAMAELRTLMVDQLEAGAAPDDAVRALDRWSRRHPSTRAATACVARLDPANGLLEYCTAGHPPPLLVPVEGSEGPRFLALSGARPIGDGGPFPLATQTLAVGDILVLYSDGLLSGPEATRLQGTVRLREEAAAAAYGRRSPPSTGPHQTTWRASASVPAGPVGDVLAALLSLAEPTDDAAVVVAQRRLPPGRLSWERPVVGPGTTETARQELGRWLDRVATGTAEKATLEYALAELVANVVDHAYGDGPPGAVRVEGRLAATGTVEVVVSDSGRWRRRRSAPGRGLGLPMVRQLVDDLAIGAGPGGTSVTLRTSVSIPVEVWTREPASRGRGEDGLSSREPLPGNKGPTQVVLRGTVDRSSAQDLRAVVAALLEPGTTDLVVDLSEVTLLASEAVRVVGEALERASGRGVRVRVLAPNGTVAHEALTLAGIAHLTRRP